jgi:hypothetical protein
VFLFIFHRRVGDLTTDFVSAYVRLCFILRNKMANERRVDEIIAPEPQPQAPEAKRPTVLTWGEEGPSTEMRAAFQGFSKDRAIRMGQVPVAVGAQLTIPDLMKAPEAT